MTDEQLDQRFSHIDQSFSAVADLIRDVANRIDQRFDAVHQRIDGLQESMDQRFTLVESRLDRLEALTTSYNKGLSDHDRVITGMLGTQEAQRRAIDDIIRRLNPPQ